MLNILNTIGESYSQGAREILESIGNVTYHTSTQEELIDLLSEIEVLVVGLGLSFTREVIESAPKLKAIATATTGLDHIDLEAAKESGVEVVSLRGETDFLNTITGTSELAFTLALNLMRLTLPSFESVKRGEWQRDRFRGNNMAGNTLGVLGLGRLGRMMAHYGHSFGMHVIAHDPNVDIASTPYEEVSFEDLISRSDILSIHVHLSPETENMFTEKEFSKMKNTCHIINTSRGKIVNEDALLRALEEKEIGGYGTDVLAGELDFKEGTFDNYPLVEYAKKHDNCIMVPHIGGMTHESREATDVFIAQKLKRVLGV